VNEARVQILTLPHGRGLSLPAHATAGAAGADIVSAEDTIIQPGGIHAVATGIALAIPEGYEGQVRPRSGLALKYGVTVLNAPGTIDADYRGEVKVILINHGPEPFRISRGDRVAQLVVAAVVPVTFERVDVLPDTARGSGGFGSTGVKGA
jgi:dUTP pyrophosphatase